MNVTPTTTATRTDVAPRRRRAWRPSLAATAFVAVALAANALAGTAAAATANGGIYVVTPAWWGHCANSGGVAGLATVNSYVGHSNPGDWGDDVAWMPVRLGTSQSVQIRVACKRFGFVTGASISASIRPTRHGQTFYFGPDSRFWSN
jgi:hypothetical protein